MGDTRWELAGHCGNNRTVAEAVQHDNVVHVVVGSETTTVAGSLEEVVRQTPQLRVLAPDMEWTLTTDLDDWTASTLLGRPVEGVAGVEINGQVWETRSDDRGPFLMPTTYSFGDRILTVLLKFDLRDDYDQAYCFDRAGPLCQLWNYAWYEAGESDHIIHEPDDLTAVERFAADLREAGSWAVAQITGNLVDRLDAGGRERLIAALAASDLAWHRAWWLGDQLWLSEGPAPVSRFAELNLANAFLRLDDDVFRVGQEQHGTAEEASGRRIVLIPTQNGDLDLLVNAAFTAGDINVDNRFAVQLDHETGGTWAGVEIDDEALHLSLAAAFGALALVVDSSQLIELGANRTRRWELMPTNDRPLETRLELSVPWR